MPRELLNTSQDVWMSEVESHFIPKFDAYGCEREHPGPAGRSPSPACLQRHRLRDAWRQLRLRRREVGSWSQAVRFLLAR